MTASCRPRASQKALGMKSEPPKFGQRVCGVCGVCGGVCGVYGVCRHSCGRRNRFSRNRGQALRAGGDRFSGAWKRNQRKKIGGRRKYLDCAAVCGSFCYQERKIGSYLPDTSFPVCLAILLRQSYVVNISNDDDDGREGLRGEVGVAVYKGDVTTELCAWRCL